MGRAEDARDASGARPALGVLLRARFERAFSGALSAASMHATCDADDRSEMLRVVRKSTKIGRALLRLARGCVDEESVAGAESLLRETSSLLAPLRDRDAIVATIGKLFAGRNDERARHVADSLARVVLVANEPDEDLPFERAAVRRAGQTIAHLAEAIRSWPLERIPDREIIEGMVRSWRIVRRLTEDPIVDVDTETSHLIRRRCARLSLQLAAFEDVMPKRIRELRRSLRAVTRGLGDEHDLELLAERMSLGRARIGSDAFANAALDLCRRARRRLRAGAADAIAEERSLRPRELRAFLR
ncbi:MAG: CHAD domain-containing protein [Phycisphaerae bacterium]|nr:CHAD domain-containing protein [Phycisphaerae bacterium]